MSRLLRPFVAEEQLAIFVIELQHQSSNLFFFLSFQTSLNFILPKYFSLPCPSTGMWNANWNVKCFLQQPPQREKLVIPHWSPIRFTKV